MSGPAVRVIAVIVALGVWGGAGIAQEAMQPDENLRRIIERLEQQDRQGDREGFVLDSYQVQPADDDPGYKSMELSIGQAGGRPGLNTFDERPSNFLLDPMAPDETPPLGLNLKLQF